MSTIVKPRIGSGYSLTGRVVAIALGIPVLIALHSVQAADPDDDSKVRLREERFMSHSEATAHAKQVLATESRIPVAVIVYSVRTPEGITQFVETKLHFVGGGRGGYIPGRTTTDEFVVRPISIYGAGQAVELRVVVPGFETHIKRDILHAGDLVVWEEIIPKPITESSAASVVGRVRVEDENEDLEGLVINVDGEPVAFTDASGYFVADTVRPGKLRVSTYKPGFVGMYTEVTVKPGFEQVCELVGYRKRSVRVRWAYQPDGTRRFDGSVVTGTSELKPNELYRISFAKGFDQVDGRSDFSVWQVKAELVLRHSDGYGPKYPASSQVKVTAFDDLQEAPETGYSNRTNCKLQPGDVFVFRCYDGEHYGKIEIVEIISEAPPTSR